MSQTWKLAGGAAPAMRCWSGEFVVHHATSNDTHRLTQSAGQLLARMMAHESAARSNGGLPPLAFDDEALNTLEALSDLGLVVRC